MHYSKLSLDGAWEMRYSECAYTGTECPQSNGYRIANAVPGYWEDMVSAFSKAPFFGNLKINPEYGIQQYPIAGVAPDMALPNVVGNFIYRRTFSIESSLMPTQIWFEGVQNAVSVWINQTFLGRHEGYSTPFFFEIPENVLRNGVNEIVVSVSNYGLNGYAGEPISGLTNRAACQYTGGIYGSVSLRTYLGTIRDVHISVSETLSRVDVEVNRVGEEAFSWAVLDGSSVITSGQAVGDFSFKTDGMTFWSCENPKLYTLEIRSAGARLSRKFGVRRLLSRNHGFIFNGKPYYLRGICEHCYYPETVHPSTDITFYRTVIRKLKKLGFNFIRFHTHIPPEEYLQAADELGILVHVESPNNTTLVQWKEIVNFCRKHTCVVIYCCGNELQMDDPFIRHLQNCSEVVHMETDSLFSPLNALRGLEYCFDVEPELKDQLLYEPIKHNPRRIKWVNSFSDLLHSFSLSSLSYTSLQTPADEIDRNNSIYGNTLLTHEIGIHGTYTDLSLKQRYRNSRIGKTDMFDSIERHLAEKNLLHRAPLYFKNSSEWQRRMRKHCFEKARLCSSLSGYDFLGPIDTHWHTFGYDVGMMNEFYELKPGETVRNVRMYNSDTVLLTDLDTNMNFTAGKPLSLTIFVSHYGEQDLQNSHLHVRLTAGEKLISWRHLDIDTVKNGSISELTKLVLVLPDVSKPAEMKLYATLECEDVFAENEWELYSFPDQAEVNQEDLVVVEDITLTDLLETLRAGKNVLLLGPGPFTSFPTSFEIALAGRTSGNLATVISDHPAVNDFPNDGYCGWQFRHLMEGGNAVCFEEDRIPFDPIIDVASSHKYAIKQALLFEYRVLRGKLLVCGMRFQEDDPAANWFRNHLINYANSNEFSPKNRLTEEQLCMLADIVYAGAVENDNIALNKNDITANRTNME